MNRWVAEAGALIVIGAVAMAWHYRASIVAMVNPPASASNPAATPDVLYTWVDKDGVTHFSQNADKGKRVEYDGTGITPMAPVEGKLLEALPATQSVGADGTALKGSATLHDMRREMVENQIKMQQNRDAAMGL